MGGSVLPPIVGLFWPYGLLGLVMRGTWIFPRAMSFST